MKLSVTQRKYMLSELAVAMGRQLWKQLIRISNKDFKASYGDLAIPDGKEKDKFNYWPAHKYSIFRQKVCVGPDGYKQWFMDSWQPSRDWFQEQIDTGAYHVDMKFEECMSHPRTRVVFDNLEKERKKAARNWRKRKDNIIALISEADYLVMEANNFYAKAKRRIMLADSTEASALLETLIKESKGI